MLFGYVNCIFLSDKGKEKYILDRDYLSLENIGFNIGDNNMYLYNLVLKKEFRDTDAIKLLMTEFSKWLYNERCNGKNIKSCISEAVTSDGIKTLLAMEMLPKDVDDKGLGIYYSPDCLSNYIEKMIKK